MINWFSKYRWPGLGPKEAPPAKAVAPVPSKPSAPVKAPAPPRAPKDTEADWAPRLQAAAGDDTALLAVLGASPVLAVKLAAVQALAGEAALKQAERAARQFDRRVHRLAKQRFDAAVAQRQTRVSAQALLASAQALVGDAGVAVNQLVVLDRDWSALDAGLLEPTQATAFATLREQLATQVRDQGERLQALKRWMADAAHCRRTLRAGLTLAATEGRTGAPATTEIAPTEAAGAEPATAEPAGDGPVVAGGLGDSLIAARATAQALLESRPDVQATEADAAALQALLDDAVALQARLAWLAEAELPPSAEAVVPPADAWAALPALADEALAPLLARRFDAWQRAWAARHAPPPRPPAAPKPPRAARPALPSAEQSAALDELLQQAEAALADGQTGALQQRLQAIEQWLDDAGPLRLPDAWLARWATVQTEGARLKGWQAWGGAQARDALVAEAETLARAAVAAMAVADAVGGADDRHAEPAADAAVTVAADAAEAADATADADADATADADAAVEPERDVADGVSDADPAVPPPGPVPGHPPEPLVAAEPPPEPETAPAHEPAPAAVAGARPPRPARLKLKAHADAIHALRQRWKQLDRQGAAAKQSTWTRFDAALQIAFQPVAAQHAAQQAVRERNQQAREGLLLELEATSLPDGDGGPVAWKDLARALDRFDLAWRALGPFEHTVPSAARGPLQQRLRAAVDRLGQPLDAAREAAASRRERLIHDAQALVDDSGRPPAMHATARVRDLQAAWQDEARALPLARKVEVALWARFKAATDAVYTMREAGFAARDAEAAAALAGREALITRLSALPADAAPDEIERLLAEVERAWRQPVDVPRGAAASLDARYADARAAVMRQGAEWGRRRWFAECDALALRLGLCDERDDRVAAGGAPADGHDELAARWAAAGDVPPSWQQALARRWADSTGAGPLPAAEVDVQLLQLEAVFDLPATAEQQAARRELKLRALKDTLEGRARAVDGEAAHQAWWLALLRQGGTSTPQRERLLRLLAALRDSRPGSLVGTVSRG